jgi:uncharacterized membrane protein
MRHEPIRNPILELEAARRAIAECTQAERDKFARILVAIGRHAEETAQTAWRQRKGPMANYWLAKGVDCRHLARALRAMREPELEL